MNDVVERIDSALTGITPGKWDVWYETCISVNPPEMGSYVGDTESRIDGQLSKYAISNAEFIAAAPGLLREAKAEIERLRAWLAEIGSLADVEADERSWMVRWALEGKTVPER